MKAQWFFDVISPFAYLQSERLDQVAASLELEFKPVLLAGLLNHWGQLGPAEIEPKKLFTYRHVLWLAKRNGVELRFPNSHPFNPLRLLRLAVLAGNNLDNIRKIFRFVWQQGQLPDNDDALYRLAEDLDITDAATRIEDPEVKNRLKANGRKAIDAGVFGVPTFVIDDHVIWGLDATEMLLDYVGNPGMFRTEEMSRAADIRPAAERKRSL